MKPSELVCFALLVFLLAIWAPACGSDRGSGSEGTGNFSDGGSSAGGGDAGLGSEGGSADPDSATEPSRPPAGAIGDPCAVDADCTEVPGSVCYRTIGGGPVMPIEFPNGFCSKVCGQNPDPRNPSGGPPADECGSTAACVSQAMAGSSGGGLGGTSFTYCAPPCTTDEECRAGEGYRCHILFGSFGSCGPGSGLPGR